MELRELLARAMLDKLVEQDITDSTPDDLHYVFVEGSAVDLLELADVALETLRGLDGTT